MNNNQLQMLKSTQVSILEDIIEITNFLQIDHFIIAGTLIGAIRHNGFIPWDDDIDIAMTRSDYQEFRKYVISNLNDKYFLQDYQSEEDYYKSFAKLRLHNTVYDESEVIHLNIHKGIFVDIFILDPEPIVKGISFKIRANLISKIGSLILYKHLVTSSTSLSIKGKIIYNFSKPIKSKWLKKMQLRLMTKYKNTKNPNYLLNYGCGYGYKKQTFSYSDYYPPIKKYFEGIEVSVPNKYDKMLTQIYGDYMKIPSIEDRVSHSPVRIEFFKKT